MTLEKLDTIDKGILYLLQENARDNTTRDIGEKLGLAASTIGTRIKRLEDRGVIEGYNPIINYERAGFDHHYVVDCTVPLEECDQYIEETIDSIEGVVSVRKFYTTEENLSLEVVGVNKQAFEDIVREMRNLDLQVERFEIIDRDVAKPFSQFGQQAVSSGDAEPS